MSNRVDQKLNEARYFLAQTHTQFNQHAPEFVFSLNAFVNAARNVTFVMQNEYAHKEGFKEWWEDHPIKADVKLSRFIELRNVSLKQGSVDAKTFKIIHDFGPEGLHVSGMKGPTKVISDPIRFDEPIPDNTYVTVDDDNGHKRVKVKLIHDFSVEEEYDHGKKTVQFDNFIKESTAYLEELSKIIEDAESKFSHLP